MSEIQQTQDGATTSNNYPVVMIVPTNSHPPVPDGQNMYCLADPDKLDPNPNCPVIQCGGLTFWVYCYNDNRLSMSVVGYDQHGHQVKQWELQGARYIWQINVDADQKVVTFIGQARHSVVLSWKELEKPAVVLEDVSSCPTNVLFGLKMTALIDPDHLDPSSKCPVVLFGDHFFWAFSYVDNRNSFCIIAVHQDGTMCNSFELPGSRYIWKIDVDEANQMVNFIGQSKQTVSLSYNDMLWPEMRIVDSTSHPAVPAGSKQTTLSEPYTLDPSPGSPIIVYKDYIFWAYSYLDNRVSMNIVAYNCAGKIVKQWELPGARYIWQITVDRNKKRVVFFGQSNKTVALNWADMLID